MKAQIITRVKFTILLIASLTFKLNAQEMTDESNKIWNVTLPSSNSWSFQDVTNANYIDHFTGRPNVNIPIHTIVTRELSFPISLNYSSSGVKVNEKPGIVGIGWSLGASGSVNRAIIGLPDEDPNGYHKRGPSHINYDGSLRDFSLDDYYATSNGLIDFQPDQYQYHTANGLSGIFFLNPMNSDELEILQVPKSDNLILKYDGYLSGTIQWIVKDIFGTNYYFGSFNNQTAIETTQTEEQSIGQKSTWYLMAIVSANGSDTIRFHYEDGGIEETEYYDEVYTKILGQANCSAGGSYCPAAEGYTSNIRLVSHQTFLLKRIETELMFVDFNTILRGNIKSIDNIKVYLKSKPSSPINEFKFSYMEYGTLNNNDFRFFLSDLVKSTPSSEEIEQFVFSYVQPEILPELNSSSIDHWGYFNGKNNPGIVQKHTIYNSINETAYEYGNANRATNTTLVYTGMLKEVIFPTGGVLNYSYESNSFCQIRERNTEPYEEINNDVVLSSRNGDTIFYFSITKPQYVTFNYTITCDEMAGGEEPQIDIILLNDGSTIQGFNCLGPGGYQQFNSGEICKLLYPGNYMVSVAGNSGDALITFSYMTHLLLSHPIEGFGGGCRVKSLSLSDMNHNSITKKYSYNLEQHNWPSSGILHNMPQYLFFQNYTKRISNCIFECNYFTISSGSRYDLQLSKGSYVNYRSVEEKIDSPNSGSTIYFFYNPTDIDDYSITEYDFPFPPSINTDWKRGMPKKIINKNFEGDPQSEALFYYDLINPYYLYGIKVGQRRFTDEFNTNLLPTSYFDIMVYRYTSADYLMVKKVNRDYLGDEVVESEEIFDYNTTLGHRQMTQSTKKTTDSQYITKIKYAKDFHGGNSDYMSAAIENMVQKNQIFPVEITKWIQNTSGVQSLIDGQLTLFRLENGSSVKDKIYTLQNKSNTNFFHSSINSAGIFDFDMQWWSKKIDFNNYSNLFRLNQRTINESGIAQSVIWGLKDNNTIATTTNSTLSESGHTSFENNELNGWTKYGPNEFETTPANVFTGKSSMEVTGASGPFQIFTVGQNAEKHSGYKASVWALGIGAYLHIEVNGEWASHVKVSNEFDDGLWHKLEVELPRHKIQPYFSQGENLKIKVYVGSEKGTVYFDDIRFHPSDAKMTTYTHEPLFGVTSISNENNQPIYYIYDPFGRLEYIKDFERNILKKNDYHYRTTSQ
jgi:hypothetical protein